MRKAVLLVVITGIIFVSVTAAFDPGDVIWEFYYPQESTEYAGCAYDVLWLSENTDGPFIVVGKQYQDGLYVGKLQREDFGGPWAVLPIWEHLYGESGDECAYSIAETSDDAIIVAGKKGDDFWLLKIDPSTGDTLWTQTYGGSGWDCCQEVRQTYDDGYILVGYTGSFGTSYQIYLVKTDSEGNMLWHSILGGVDTEYAYGVRQTSDGGYIIAATTYSFGAGECDAYVVRTDDVGYELWAKTYGGSDRDRVRSVDLTSDGGYVFAGWTESFGAGGPDFWVIKTDANGDTLWTRTYGGNGADYGLSIEQTWEGGYIIGGPTDSYGSGAQDFWLVKTDSSGDTLWTLACGDGSDGGTDRNHAAHQMPGGEYVTVGEGVHDSHGHIYIVVVEGAKPPQVTVISPNGSEGFEPGDTCDITWLAEDNIGVDSISILYSIDAGSSWETIASGEENDSTYSWTIPNTPSDNCLVKIYAYDAGLNVGEDQSNAVFSISTLGIEENNLSPGSFELLLIVPNPFRGSTEITFSMEQSEGSNGITSGSTSLTSYMKIYDVGGRLIRQWDYPTASQSYRVVWDGRNESGCEIPPGVYLVRFETRDHSVTKKVLLLR